MKRKSASIAALWTLILQDREFYPLVIIFSIFVSFLTLATPISVQSLVNTFSFGPYIQPLIVLSLLLLALLSMLGIVKSLQYLVVEYLQRRIFSKVTAQISRGLIENKDYTDEELSSLVHRYFDSITVQKTLAFLLVDGVTVFLQVILGLILISLYHPYFIVFGMLILAALIMPIYFLSPIAMARAHKESSTKYKVADFLDTLVAKKNFSLEDKIADIDGAIDEFLKYRSHHFQILFTQNIVYMICFAVLNAILLGLGGYLVIKNQLTVGQLVAAEIVVNAMLSHFRYAHKYFESFYDLYAASNKIIPFYDDLPDDTESSIPGAKGLQPSYFEKFSSIMAVWAPKDYKKIIKTFAISIVSVVILVFLVPWQQTSQGDGRVIALDPNDRQQTITATVNGLIEEWLVQDGQMVAKGDPIVKIVDNDPNFLIRLESRRDAALKKFEAAKEASDTARLNFHRQETLVKEGLSSRKEFEQAKIKYKKLQAEEAMAVASLAKAEVDLSRQQLQEVTAPRAGRILRILHGSGTTNVKSGDPLVEFVPVTSQTSVELFIDGNDLPLIYEGRKVRLQFEGWPSVQFTGWPSVAIGSFGGVIQAVDPSVSQNGTFRILVVPDPEEEVPWPKTNFLRQGSRTLGLVLLDEVSIGYELWRKMNGFPKSMDRSPEPKDKKASKK